MSHPDPSPSCLAERSALACCLMDRAAFADVASILSLDDFERESHRTVFACMLRLRAAEKDVDLITLVDALIAWGYYDSMGGDALIESLVDSVTQASGAKSFAQIVKKAALQRRDATHGGA